MSIRSKIAWAALGCVLLSGVAYADQPAKPDPKHSRDSRDKPTRDKHERGTSTQPVDPAGMPPDGTGAAGPATGAAAIPAASLQQLGCNMFMPPVGVPSAGPMKIQVMNWTSEVLPVGTVIWIGPPEATANNGITRPDRGTNPDGTPAHMDRYYRLTSDVPPGVSFSPIYSPNPPWPVCAAVTGMTSLISAVAFVE